MGRDDPIVMRARAVCNGASQPSSDRSDYIGRATVQSGDLGSAEEQLPQLGTGRL